MRSSSGKIVALLAGALCFFGCPPEMAALVSGTVVDDGLGSANAPKKWALSDEQLRQVYSWLQLHKSDWHINVAPQPAPSYSVFLSHSDGMHTKIGLYSGNESSKQTIDIYIRNNDGKLLFGRSYVFGT